MKENITGPDHKAQAPRGIIAICLAPERIPPGAVERLRAAGGRDVLALGDRTELQRFAGRVEIGVGDVPFDLIPEMPLLKWVQLWSAGADSIQRYPQLKDHPFLLTTTSGMHGPQIAEHVFGLLLAWNRRLPEAFAHQALGQWKPVRPQMLSCLDGASMLILGYGSIGRRLARAALGFGMSVTGIRRGAKGPSGPPVPREEEGVRVASASRLPDLLPQADVVVNILPLTAETRHSFGRAEFAAMKKTALYVNVGRGPTTDQEALTRALDDGTIAGALLDVTEPEPLPGDSPLWKSDRLLLTAHYAGFHPNYNEIALGITLDNLGRYVRGEALKNLVDKSAGY
ncbi:MAG: D-2-hydroxyacid dehydrogenase [Spirochaetaceae bacterium]|jgi:phosphoglycerate dehydrogenase-like enzyme|nr:D-2-hydroxyacid dehydrogenase [Spirochaetaceae bacterium]